MRVPYVNNFIRCNSKRDRDHIHTLLDLIHTLLDLIHARLDLIHTLLDLIHARLDLIHTLLDLIHPFERLHHYKKGNNIKVRFRNGCILFLFRRLSSASCCPWSSWPLPWLPTWSPPGLLKFSHFFYYYSHPFLHKIYVPYTIPVKFFKFSAFFYKNVAKYLSFSSLRNTKT